MRIVNSLATSVLVTAFVAGPLAWRAAVAEDDAPSAPADGIVALVEGQPASLDGLTLTDSATVSFEIPNTAAVSYRLVDDSGREIAAGADIAGPEFTMLSDDEQSALFRLDDLTDGDFTMFVTITTFDPDTREIAETQRMARFHVGAP